MSWGLFQDALESDIKDIQGGTTREGIHLGAIVGTVDLILRCYSGIENRCEVLCFNPSLPSELRSIQFSINYRGNWLDIHVNAKRISLHSRQEKGHSIKIAFADSTFLLSPGETKKLNL